MPLPFIIDMEKAADIKLKTQVLLATAEAYYLRGEWLQYDQLSMDRIVRISTRRESFAPPETAAPSRTLHLDCSSFVWAVYYTAFAHMLEADLTWHMTRLLRPEVFYYEPTHAETPEALSELKNRVRGLLRAGDVITYFKTTGNGHAMLYLGEGKIINCSGYGVMSDYDYNACHANYKKGHGAIYIEDLRAVVEGNGAFDSTAMSSHGPVALAPNYRNYLFGEEIHRFSIHRPLDIVGEPLPDALKRIKETSELVCIAEPELPAGCTAASGEKVKYTVTVINKSEASGKWVEVCFNGDKKNLYADLHESVSAEFELCGSKGDTFSPNVSVNGMKVYCRELYCGRVLTANEAEQITSEVLKEVGSGKEVFDAAFKAYEKAGAKLYSDCRTYLTRLFFRQDALNGDVLSRRTPQPEIDGDAYGLYGGKGVISPESGFSFIDRTRDMRLDALMAGDIIIVSDDAVFSSCRSFYYTGSALLGEGGEDAGRLVESLFGYFAFAVIRPSLTMD